MMERLVRRLKEDCALAPGSHVLMAVSGGADSVAMLCLFKRLAADYPLTLSCAHVEHGIRGAQSLEDCAFVRSLCQRKNIPFYTASVDAVGYAKANGCGLEDAARTLRHDFLDRTADKIGADAIALAHHAGDQAETVLLHAARGSDLRGICAMRFRRGRLIRPLLDAQPRDLRAYLVSIGQNWREDATNADPAYARNRMRLEALPAMEAAVPGAAQALCRLAGAAQRDEDYFEKAIDALDLPVISLVDGAAMEKAGLCGLHPALLSRVLCRLCGCAGLGAQNAASIAAIMQALFGDDEVVNLPRGAHAVVGRRHLCLVRPESAVQDTPLCVPGVTDTPFGRFEIRKAGPEEYGNGKTCQSIPRRLLEGAVVAQRREGETMIPFGMHSPVKLKKLMIDAGVERAMRNSIPVIRRDDTVLFAVGLRPAACVRSTEEEERMIVRFLGAWPGMDGRQNNWEENSHD